MERRLVCGRTYTFLTGFLWARIYHFGLLPDDGMMPSPTLTTRSACPATLFSWCFTGAIYVKATRLVRSHGISLGVQQASYGTDSKSLLHPERGAPIAGEWAL